jgi:hypothetical protein
MLAGCFCLCLRWQVMDHARLGGDDDGVGLGLAFEHHPGRAEGKEEGRRHEQQQKSSVSKSTQHTPKSSIVSYNTSGALLIRSENSIILSSSVWSSQ